ncbi:MAG: NAD(+) kinase [Synechococcales cyanobacterium]
MHLQQVIIAYKEGNRISKEACQWCAEQLRQLNVTVLTAPTGLHHNPYPVFLEATSAPIDLAIVLGGDGSVLAAARHLAPHGIPILAIKSGGSLGFLAQADQVLRDHPWERLHHDDFVWQPRLMLQAQIQRQGSLREARVPGQPIATGEAVSEVFYALNEMCLKPTTRTHLAASLLEIEANGEVLDQYHGDGVLVSTPTGSTSYTVAANGPIIAPELDVLTITPICPLSLSSRPVVISAQVQVDVWPLSDPEGLTRLWTDGVLAQSVNPGEWVTITRAPLPARMVVLEKNLSYFRTLREKLQWAGSRIHVESSLNHRQN